MRFLFVIILFLPFQLLLSQELSLAQVRLEFSRLSVDSCTDNNLYRRLIQTPYTANVAKLAYVGGMEAMMARCYNNPFKKLAYFNAGKEKIENAIAANNNNLDARFVRLQIQINAPSVLGYNKNILEDKKIIIRIALENLQKGTNEQFCRQILEFLCDSPYITTQEKEIIKTKLTD